MTDARRKAVTLHRERRKRDGLVRVEVQVRRQDAGLLRSVAGALANPERADVTRTMLREGLGLPAAKGLKALLAEAPLDGIDLERARDPGREVDL